MKGVTSRRLSQVKAGRGLAAYLGASTLQPGNLPMTEASAARELTPAYFSHPSFGLVLQRLVTGLIAGLAARLRHAHGPGDLTA